MISRPRQNGTKNGGRAVRGFPEDTLRNAIAIYDDPADLLARYMDSPLAKL